MENITKFKILFGVGNYACASSDMGRMEFWTHVQDVLDVLAKKHLHPFFRVECLEEAPRFLIPGGTWYTNCHSIDGKFEGTWYQQILSACKWYKLYHLI